MMTLTNWDIYLISNRYFYESKHFRATQRHNDVDDDGRNEFIYNAFRFIVYEGTSLLEILVG